MLKIPRVSFSDSFANTCPSFRVGIVACDLIDTVREEALYKEIDIAACELREKYDVGAVKQLPAIFSTRMAYKRCGKDPNRYRPASEQLCRRIINGNGVYRVHPLVDLGNLISIKTGYSIGMFDRTKISGNDILLRIGTSKDVFYGIGRGLLNIEGLPVYVDSESPFATPTSDHERTKILGNTTKVLIFVNDFGTKDIPMQEEDMLSMALSLTKELLYKYCTLEEYRQTCYQVFI